MPFVLVTMLCLLEGLRSEAAAHTCGMGQGGCRRTLGGCQNRGTLKSLCGGGLVEVEAVLSRFLFFTIV